MYSLDTVLVEYYLALFTSNWLPLYFSPRYLEFMIGKIQAIFTCLEGNIQINVGNSDSFEIFMIS